MAFTTTDTSTASAVEDTSTTFTFNPFDPDFRVDPYPTYARLRQGDPVHRTLLGSLAFSRYRDCARLLRDTRLSSDARKSTTYQQQANAAGDPPRVFGEVGGIRPFLFMDDPDHGRLRSLVQQAFTPNTVEVLRPRIAALVDELLAPVRDLGTFEVIEGLARPLPLRVICEMLGVPGEDLDLFESWSKEFARAHDPDFATPPDVLERRDAAAQAFIDYFTQLIRERRRRPRADLISALITAEEEGNRLSHEELLSTLILLLVAGHETTVNLIGNGVLALCRHPASARTLRERPELIPTAVNEVLRYDPPVQLTARVALEDIAIGDETLGKGEQALLLLAAANRDEEQFPHPDTFDVARSPNRHLGFSLGAHYCLGAPLARAEAEAVLEYLLGLGEWDLATDILRYRENVVLRGLEALPIAVTFLRP